MENIAEILKNAPQGLKLYSLVHGEVTLKKVDTTEKYYHIETIDKQHDNFNSFTQDGKLYAEYKDDECILFPSREHKSWDNWQEILFQKGDVITVSGGEILLFNSTDYAFTNKLQSRLITKRIYRYATPEEREQFMAELNVNGYKWNTDTKQIEKSLQQKTPKYKVGDWIKHLTLNNKKEPYVLYKIIGMNDTLYQLELRNGSQYNKLQTLIENETYWKLATEQELNDVGIKEKSFIVHGFGFKPFDKILVRNSKDEKWHIDLFGFYKHDDKVCIGTGGFRFRYYIPYNDETKHLLGTTDDCPDKYKTWED